jgi:hypothetical protein
MPIKKTAAQFVFDHLNEIEHKIAMGIYHTAILADLAEAGHEMTLASFRKCLSRARGKKKRLTTVYQPIPDIDPTHHLSAMRLTPDELAQIEKCVCTTQRGFI